MDEFKRHDSEDDATKFDRVANSILKAKVTKKGSPVKSTIPETGSEVGSFKSYYEKKNEEPTPPYQPRAPPPMAFKTEDPHTLDIKRRTEAELSAANRVKFAFAMSRAPPGSRKAYEEAMWQQEMERRRLKAERQSSLNNAILLGLGFLVVLGLGYYGYQKVTGIAYEQGRLMAIEHLYKHLPEAAKSIQP